MPPVDGLVFDATFVPLGTSQGAGFTWRIDLHHATHTHPEMPDLTGVSSGTWTLPDTGHTETNIWYRVHLTVTQPTRGVFRVFAHTGPRDFSALPEALEHAAAEASHEAEALAREAAARYRIPGAHGWSDLAAVLEREGPDFVDIITPPETHLEAVRLAGLVVQP